MLTLVSTNRQQYHFHWHEPVHMRVKRGHGGEWESVLAIALNIDRALVNDRSNRVSLVIEKKTGPEKIPIEAAYWSDAVHKERYEVLRLLAAEEDAKVRERREQLKEDEKRRAEEARQVAAYSSAML